MKRATVMVLLGLAWGQAAVAADMGSREAKGTGGMATMDGPVAAVMDGEAKKTSAMSAAPEAISAEATLMDFPAGPGQKPATLRKGSNGWTCFPDNPGTPGKDPMCLDKEWMNWMQAYLGKTKPRIKGVGMAYMLQGGTDASNIDPFATEPRKGEQWMHAGPHVMVISPHRWDRQMYPTEMKGGGPWVMFPGTPYEHLMVPVQ